MDKNEIAYQQLLQGIQEYTQECLDNGGYDKTYTAIIKSVTTQGYTILLNGQTYENIKTIGGTCVVNETVKVIVPQNNFSNMFILKGGTSGEPIVGGVSSVNGKQGDVVLNNEDVGALSNSYKQKLDLWDLLINNDGSLSLRYNGG
ncbi:MAG: hypothetical protein KBT03_03660 [Bacteroidales bacterium]|nr:hypothetical protein [Candidatus Scybalousia scybalohippi]